MTSREDILAAVKAAKPAYIALPPVYVPPATAPINLVESFAAAAEAAGAIVKNGSREEVAAQVAAHACEAVIGVAENGALWLPVSRLGGRREALLATDMIVILQRGHIVADLHAAYDRIDVAAEGYGVFIAGPSKTADIEQALVIGAQGAMTLTVVLVD